MADNKSSLEIPKHDIHVNATVKERSLLAELGKSAMDEYILPKTTEIAHGMFTDIINMVADALKSSVSKILYPNGGAPTKRSSSSGVYTGVTNYTSFSTPIKTYQSSNQPSASTIGQRPGNMVNYIWVESEEKAKLIRDTLRDDIQRYHKAKVATLYEMTGQKTTMADFNYGWTNPNDIGYYEDTSRRPGENRWFIDLARPVDITTIS